MFGLWSCFMWQSFVAWTKFRSCLLLTVYPQFLTLLVVLEAFILETTVRGRWPPVWTSPSSSPRCSSIHSSSPSSLCLLHSSAELRGISSSVPAVRASSPASFSGDPRCCRRCRRFCLRSWDHDEPPVPELPLVLVLLPEPGFSGCPDPGSGAGGAVRVRRRSRRSAAAAGIRLQRGAASERNLVLLQPNLRHRLCESLKLNQVYLCVGV